MFDIYVDYDDVWLHSAATMKKKPEFTLHFHNENKATGDLTIRFPSIESIDEFIENLQMAFHGPQSSKPKVIEK